jgi:hypothetical protein
VAESSKLGVEKIAVARSVIYATSRLGRIL